MVLSFTTPRSPSRPIPTLIILCLKGDVNYMVVTLTIFLDLDLFFYSLNGDTELIERDNDILDVSWLQRRYRIEFMGYQVSWWSSRLRGSHIIQFSFNVWLDNFFLIGLVLKWPWRNTVNRCLIPPFFLNSLLLQIQLEMILHNVQALVGSFLQNGWIHERSWNASCGTYFSPNVKTTTATFRYILFDYDKLWNAIFRARRFWIWR